MTPNHLSRTRTASQFSRNLLGLCAALLLTLPAGPAAADTGPELLAKMDAAMNRAKDQTFEYEIITEEKGREPKVMEVRVRIKGAMRYTEFMAPGDMVGTKVLVRSRTQMWIYLPAYAKVRRIASHAMKGNFMGTTIANEDISTTSYGGVYDGKLLSETGDAWIVEATPKPDQETSYGKLVFTISKQFMVPVEIKYFNDKGQHIKTETRTGTSCQGDICNAEVMTMVDHTRNDASTRFVRRKWDVNTGVGDEVFELRNLE